MGYPVGIGGETYRWFSPRPSEGRFSIKGLSESFLGAAKRKLMRLTDDGQSLMAASVEYDMVLYAPHNGPFEVKVDFDPRVFKRFEVKHQFKRVDKDPDEPDEKAE